MKIKKFKMVSWYNEKDREIIYGIDALTETGEKVHVCDDKGPLFHKTKKEVRAAISELKKTLVD
jgi:hypothetical protein